MSDHYTFALSMRLRADVTDCELAALRYIVDGEGQPPSLLPNHDYFSDGLPREYAWQTYRDFTPGSFLSQSWCSRNRQGLISDLGVHLYLPAQKLEGAYGSPFALAQWLATLSSSVGCVGSITCDDDNRGIPTLLFVYERELHIASFDSGSSIYSVVTDKPYSQSDG